MEVLDAAAELPPEERRAYLAARSDDSSLGQEVLQLLEEMESPAAPVRAAMQQGERIGRYVVEDQLGRGGMGEVYAARDTELDRTVALKVLSAERLGGPFGVERLIREARTLSALNHPNIVTVHEVVQAGPFFAIVMELVEGTPVRPGAGSAADPDHVCRIGQQIARALAAAHARGIIHRDIKPENVLVRADGYVKVLDFGLARRIGSQTNTTSAGLPAGTIRYMSPEQSRGENLTPASDVFSLGTVLYELATGRHPFAADSLFETAHAIAAQEPAAPSSVNPALATSLSHVIAAMLRKNPAERPSAAEVDALLSGSQRHQIAPPPQARRISRRRIIGVAAGAGIGVTAAGALLWRRQTGVAPFQVLVDQGEAQDPAFSPDESRIVFSWRPAGAKHFHLYVMDVRGGTPERLTNLPAHDKGPVWSSDGKLICFSRHGAGDDALFLKDVRDNSERRLTNIASSSTGGRVAWIANTRDIAYAEVWFDLPMWVLNTETGVRRKLVAEPFTSYSAPACSPDGQWITFHRSTAATAGDLFVIPTAGGAARQLTFDHHAKREHRWTPDGRGILLKSRMQGRWGTWYQPLEGGAARQVQLPHRALGPFDVRSAAGGSLQLVSADRRQVAAIYRIDVPASGQAPSKPFSLVASGDRGESLDVNPAVSPDGFRVAFVSTRSGTPELWVCHADGEGASQLTSFGGSEVSQPAWSPDGRFLVSAASPGTGRNLFTVNTETKAIRWLTDSIREETEPQWSRDGRWIHFASNRSGSQQLWRMPAGGGAAEPLTTSGGAVHRESPDGRWLYFVRDSQPGLFRIPAHGGPTELALNRVSRDLYRAWAVGRKGVYYTYRDPSTGQWIVALYDPDRQTERILSRFDRPLPRWSGTMSLSPDERWLLLPIMEVDDSRLVLVSGVRV